MANRFEQLVEYIINDDQDKARALFHDIVVEKSRDIYEGLVDEELADEADISDEPVDDLADEIDADEEGLDGDIVDTDDLSGDEDFDDEGMGDEEFDDEVAGDLEDEVLDLRSEFDALKAEFEALKAEEAEEPEHADLDLDSDEDSDFDMDDEMGDEEFDNDEEFGDEGIGGDMGDEDMDDEELVREYVEKVNLPSNKSEGGEVGAGKSVGVNKKSIVDNMKNDMGGTNKNMNKTGTEATPDGNSPKQANNYGTKGKGDLPHAGQFKNVPGNKKVWDKKEGMNWQSAKSGEGKTVGSNGSVSVNSKNTLQGGRK